MTAASWDPVVDADALPDQEMPASCLMPRTLLPVATESDVQTGRHHFATCRREADGGFTLITNVRNILREQG